MLTSNRRTFLGLAGATPLALFGLASAVRGADSTACYNPEMLPASQKSMRKALGFTEVSADPAKSCSGCAFFTGATNGCGKCQLLSGGPVSATSLCRSWAKKG